MFEFGDIVYAKDYKLTGIVVYTNNHLVYCWWKERIDYQQWPQWIYMEHLQLITKHIKY